MSGSGPPGGAAEVGRETTWSGHRLAVWLLLASAIVLDGFDNQVLSHIIPSLSREWKLPRESFAPALALGLLGMSAGTIISGWLGDRLGRRTVLMASLILFGLMTSLCATASGIGTLIGLRILAGIGLGGAVPNATVMINETAPARHRAAAVALGIVCIPVGGVIAGLIASVVAEMSSWRLLVLIGGMAPVALVLVMLKSLPESPDYLAAHRRSSTDRWRPSGLRPPERESAVRSPNLEDEGSDGHRASETALTTTLFARDYLRDTLSLWLAFGACLAAVYSCFNWLPTVLMASGLRQSQASAGLAAFNFGGIFGALLIGWLAVRYGSRRPIIAFALAAIGPAMVLSISGRHGGTPGYALALLVLEGFLINGVQVMLFAIAANTYPKNLRATGLGLAVGVGRLAAVTVPFLAAPLAARSAGASDYFLLIAGLMALSIVALCFIRRHVPASARSLEKRSHWWWHEPAPLSGGPDHRDVEPEDGPDPAAALS